MTSERLDGWPEAEAPRGVSQSGIFALKRSHFIQNRLIKSSNRFRLLFLISPHDANHAGSTLRRFPFYDKIKFQYQFISMRAPCWAAIVLWYFY